MNNKYFYFNNVAMNMEQAHNTVHQLHYSIRDFNMDYLNRAIGRLKFFIDLYMDIESQLQINETVVIDNYIEFAKKLCVGYDDDELSDLMNDYYVYLQNQIADIMNIIKENNMTDIEDIINFIGSQKHLNFQEQQFILDYYYAVMQ